MPFFSLLESPGAKARVRREEARYCQREERDVERLEELRERVEETITSAMLYRAFVDAYVAYARRDVASFLKSLVAATCVPDGWPNANAAMEVRNVDIARWLGVDKGTVTKWLNDETGSAVPVGSFVFLTDYLPASQIAFPSMEMRRSAGVAGVATLFAREFLNSHETLSATILSATTCHWITKVLYHESEVVAELMVSQSPLVILTEDKLRAVLRHLTDRGMIRPLHNIEMVTLLAEFEFWLRPILVAYERIRREFPSTESPVRPPDAF